MVFILVALAITCCFLPAILGFLLSLAFFSLIAGPLIIFGVIGFILIANSIAKWTSTKPPKPKKYINKPKQRMVNIGGQEVPLGWAVYSVLSSIIVAPILIIALILFVPSFIALPLVFITIGIEIGRWSRPKKKTYGPAVNCKSPY